MHLPDTERLALRRLTLDDAEFILELVNEPAWLQHIGDRKIHTLEASREYLDKGPLESYRRHGFGLYAVERKGTRMPIGICGLIRREGLADVDLGFALLARFCGQGYAVEAARATLAHGQDDFGLTRIVAITSPGNGASIRLLERLGFRFECFLRLTPEAAEIRLYAVDLDPSACRLPPGQKGKPLRVQRVPVNGP